MIEDAYHLCAREIALPPELIQGLLHWGSKLLLGGASKSYKTWMLLLLALCIAYGLPWLGYQTAQARVLFVISKSNPRLFDDG